MPYPVTTAYEIDVARAAGVAASFGEKAAIATYGGAVYTTAFDLTVPQGTFYIYKSLDGGITWSPITTGIESDQIGSDYYWDGTSSVFYFAVRKAVGALIEVVAGSFNMATETITTIPNLTGVENGDNYVRYARGAYYVLHLANPGSVPSVSYSSGAAWTTVPLGSGMGGANYAVAGACVDDAGRVHVFHKHVGASLNVGHSIVDGTTLSGPDWVSVGLTTSRLSPQSVQFSQGHLMYWCRVDRIDGFQDWLALYSDTAELSAPLTSEGGFNFNWTTYFIEQSPNAGGYAKSGDVVVTPTGFTLFWGSRGTSGIERKMKYLVADDLGSIPPEVIFWDGGDPANDFFDCSARLLDDGEYHAVFAPDWSGGFTHQFGAWDNWWLNPYAGGAIPSSGILNYAY